jgi:hypothetical protein
VRPSETTASLDNIQDHLADYVTGGSPDDRFAGALGKSLLLAEITGRNPHAFGGFDLETELRARLQPTGIKAGRFTDDAKFGDPTAASQDFSNGFGQGVAMLALSRTHDGVPASAISFLLDQQCPGGGFRSTYDATPPAVSTRGCTADAQADPDSTAIALDVLITVPDAAGVHTATTKAVTALLVLQDAAGGFPSAAGTLDANTTGLAGQALRSAGQTAAADKAATFLGTVQLTSAQVTGGPAAAEVGAIAFTGTDHDAAVAAGIADSARDKFHRATAQGVLGLGLAPYGVVATPPVVVTTTTTGATTTTGPTTTTTAAGATTSTSTSASTTVVAAGSQNGSSPLPKTGTDVIDMVIVGLALLGIGESVRRGAREQARRSHS